MVERVEARRGEVANLPHAAAPHFPQAPRVFDERTRPCEHAANGRAKALREAHGHRIHSERKVLGGGPRRGHGIPKTRTIEMRRQAESPRFTDRPRKELGRPHAPARSVVRVFESDKSRTWRVIRIRLHAGREFFR